MQIGVFCSVIFRHSTTLFAQEKDGNVRVREVVIIMIMLIRESEEIGFRLECFPGGQPGPGLEAVPCGSKFVL